MFARVKTTDLSPPITGRSVPPTGQLNVAGSYSTHSKAPQSCRNCEQLLSAKSFEQVIEIQSQYAKRAYDAYVAEWSKLGEMYTGLTSNAYKPVEQAAAKAGSPNRLRSA